MKKGRQGVPGRNAELIRLLMEVSVAVSANEDVDLILRMVRDSICHVGFADRAGVWVYQDGLMHGTWGSDIDGKLKDEHAQVESFEELVNQSSPDMRRLIAGELPYFLTKYDYQTPDGLLKVDIPYAALSLQAGTEWIGMVIIDNFLSARPLEEEDVMALVPFATQAAFAIHRLRLVNALQAELVERKRAERDLTEARDHALAATQAKSQFLANMSHEIRTPMNGVLGMTDLLLSTELDEEQATFAQTIRQSADSLLHIINEILDFSMIESGKMLVNASEFDLKRTIRDVCELLMPSAVQKKIMLCHKIDSKLPKTVMGDQNRIRQVLTNLIGNAIKFTEQGEVTVLAREIQQRADHRTLRIEVKDTGIGIPEDRQHAIFESFTQADGSTTRRFGGTGLGLTISRQLIELMNGRMGLSSAPGKGSTFWIELGLAKPAYRSALRESEPGVLQNTKRRARILVAEDNPVNQQVIRLQLKRMGYECAVVSDGEEAIETFLEENFDLVLMDVQMPVMDGLDATILMRVQEGRMRTPIIAMTAHAMAPDRDRCIRAGMDDYLAKPVKAERLEAMIRKWLPSDDSRMKAA